MKKTLILLSAILLTITSCKNPNRQTQQTTTGELEEQRECFSESILATIDDFAESLITHTDDANSLNITLTDNEKLVKPDFLFNPKDVDNLVTKNQKVAALAFMLVDREISRLYDLPTEEYDAQIAKLQVELNHFTDIDQTENLTASEQARRHYEACKQNGNIVYFWQFNYSVLAETVYIISQTPELYFRQISEQDYTDFYYRWIAVDSAINELAPLDPEMRMFKENIDKHRVAKNEKQAKEMWGSLEAAKAVCLENKANIAERRASMLE